MKKIKYYYNTHTLRYEKLETPLSVKLLRVLGFMATAIVTAVIIVAVAFRYLASPREKILRQKYDKVRENYSLLEDEINVIDQKLAELEKRDNQVYRSIFEANPIPDSARARAIATEKEQKLIQSMSDDELSESIAKSIEHLNSRIVIQVKSYGELENMLRNKEALLAATPAIQPVSNKELTRVASGFGYRIDPVYKTVKFHAGLDFSAPTGTPIYATADGVVKTATFSTSGYGNHVVIFHGYGYETLYGHMTRMKVRAGQKVKRGEVIGWTGSTGKSTGPHCHYEVHKNGRPVDPIYFFYNDLTPEQFDRILKLASANNQSFD